jgi:hypothetical protein
VADVAALCEDIRAHMQRELDYVRACVARDDMSSSKKPYWFQGPFF